MKHNQLTKGNITKSLTGLAIPIMGTSFLQMAYNMVDMMWIGRLGADSVAAVGTAGYFMWLSFSLVILARVGTEGEAHYTKFMIIRPNGVSRKTIKYHCSVVKNIEIFQNIRLQK